MVNFRTIHGDIPYHTWRNSVPYNSKPFTLCVTSTAFEEEEGGFSWRSGTVAVCAKPETKKVFLMFGFPLHITMHFLACDSVFVLRWTGPFLISQKKKKIQDGLCRIVFWPAGG
ncbi:unnamed protein product [Ectocarpus sp. 6 AP-2014]